LNIIEPSKYGPKHKEVERNGKLNV